ncbi:hypothetical protein MYAM1_001503 [Malassezia yamatoensis]|uniref:Uncharacterized protein n=1 Tax=Malassezia yamatoensis TaxID=253288 RepID=A0AAJ6CIE9_9BASI|nr:hypothetical protein MYAM1_001503 [Malassezia yamatoensis]
MPSAPIINTYAHKLHTKLPRTYSNDRTNEDLSAVAQIEPVHPVTSTDNEDDNQETDLGEVVESDEYLREESQDESSDSETDDSAMAKQIEAAGEGGSLIGSDDSSDEAHLANEERYIIRDEMRRSSESSAGSGISASADTEEGYTIDHDDEFWKSLSPMKQGTDDGIGAEMFRPQRGFVTSPEPSFSDFFESSDEIDEKNAIQGNHEEVGDDDLLTTDDDTTSDSEHSSISSCSSIQAPMLAHMGLKHSQSNAQNEFDEEFTEADQEESLKSAIPLLVIEDLDGRLIYARAGDGEAVFGSDGEFECVGDSQDENSSDDQTEWNDTNSGMSPEKRRMNRVSSAQSHAAMYESDNDGDTTDELPDDDMPYPRLLIGSIAPRGGRNARRAREIAAQSRRSSPKVIPNFCGERVSSRSNTKGSSNLANVHTVGDECKDTSESSTDPLPRLAKQSISSSSNSECPATPYDTNAARGDLSQEPESCKPEMGRFIPATSKSVHRAVIDGSKQTPSPFSSYKALQHGFGKLGTSTRLRSFDDSDSSRYSMSARRKRVRDEFEQGILDLQNSEDLHATTPIWTWHPYEQRLGPESMSQQDVMDLGDVLDENLIREDLSSESDLDDNPNDHQNDQEHSTGSQTSASQRRQADRMKSTEKPGLNHNAFARWHRVPITAFRESQQGGNSMRGSLSDPFSAHSRPSDTYLLTYPSYSTKRQLTPRSIDSSSRSAQAIRGKQSSFLQRDSSRFAASPLHRTLADLSMFQGHSNKRSPLRRDWAWQNADDDADSASGAEHRNFNDHTVVGGDFVVSPTLTPIKHSSKIPRGNDSSGTYALNSMRNPRKVTKREKRERQAKREALRKTPGSRHDRLRPEHHLSPSPASPSDLSLAL